MIRNTLPQGLVDNPRLDQWVAFEPQSRRVDVRTGKVEIGQGVLTALRQIAAEELDVAPERVRMASGDTAVTPEEGYTAGSLSVENSGSALRLVCAEVRALLLTAAAERLSAPAETLDVADGRILRDGAPSGLDVWDVAPILDLAARATGSVPTKRADAYRLVGQSLARLDLPAKVFGGGFIHDIALPGMLHARVLHRPWPGARLVATDEELARIARDTEVVRDGSFVAFVGPDEAACAAALGRAWTRLAWQGGTPLDEGEREPSALVSRPTKDRTLGETRAPRADAAIRLRETWTKPYQAHASIGPSCALARFDGDRLEVFSHSQGVGLLRGALAQVLGMPAESIVVRHRQGAGCYGHNGADDVALDAALVARARPGLPVRVLWMREDELSSSPFAAAMHVTIEAGCDAEGTPLDWTLEVVSPTHNARPGIGGTPNLLSGEVLEAALPRPKLPDVPDERGGGATRNALALYDIPQRIVHRLVEECPVRTSAMRGLGAPTNVFAIEGMIDEIAGRVGRDPVAYRLALLSDPRGRRVIERVAATSAWEAGAEGGAGKDGAALGRGIAFSRYKNRAGYAAIVAEVEVEEEVRVTRIWAAVDAGLVVNPDGARNQIEGGIVQAISLALKEQVLFEDGRVATATWDRYPILTFSEVPEIAIDLVGDASDPAVGLGEVSAGPTIAAVGNAVAHALGVRIRDLPLSRDRLLAALA